MIPDAVIAEIRARVDIVALVGEFVRLKKQGNSHVGLCPFHQEKSGSFYVHPNRHFFHCFGCQASGDVFAFMMRIEGLSFPEVARDLAERAGVELPDSDPVRDAEVRRERQRSDRLASVVDAAAGYFIEQVTAHPLGAMAREAWEARGVSAEIAASFRLGYAPHGWDGLTNHLRTKGHSPSDAEAVGLLVGKKNGSGHYDRFRHRLMFPVSDHQGRIVAFSGRQLDAPPGEEEDEDAKRAKYVNSPESPLFTKGKVLYGLHEGRVPIRRGGWVVVCEGNFDLVKLHQGGFDNAVAPLGTSLTEDHAKLLKRFAERVVLLFDGDAAGGRAVRKSYDVLQKYGLSTQVVTLPPGDDPDTFLTREGNEALQRHIDAAPGIVEHLIDAAAAGAGRDASEKARAIAELGPILMKVSPVEARLHVERVARKFGVRDVDAVRQQLRRGVRSRKGSRAPAVSKVQPRGRVGPLALPPVEREAFGALLDVPTLFKTEEAKEFGELLTSPDLRAMFVATARLVEASGGVEAPALLERVREDPALTEQAVGWLEGRLALQKYDEAEGQFVLRDALPRMEKKWRERRLATLKDAIVEARRRGDHALAQQLTDERTVLFRGARTMNRTDEKGSRGDDGDEGQQFEDHDA